MPERDKSVTLSLSRGPPLATEIEIGALTLAGYIRDVAGRFAAHEAGVILDGAEVVRWTYADLLDRAMDVAKALVARGLAKGERVGICFFRKRPDMTMEEFRAPLTMAVSG